MDKKEKVKEIVRDYLYPELNTITLELDAEDLDAFAERIVKLFAIPDMEMEEAEVISMQCDYACFAIENDENEINTADASAFFLEGYLEAKNRLKSNER